jgi:hypothetical protein
MSLAMKHIEMWKVIKWAKIACNVIFTLIFISILRVTTRLVIICITEININKSSISVTIEKDSITRK